jgi:hypothetical protein
MSLNIPALPVDTPIKIKQAFRAIEEWAKSVEAENAALKKRVAALEAK